eukprot:GHVP01051489.1.p1 GENE.GHVP01051489.1~~GHVP01051489.1.p1  ORF type:complete len:746 (+),score=114.64 GHVP01051489.1:1352-3589(+)
MRGVNPPPTHYGGDRTRYSLDNGFNSNKSNLQHPSIHNKSHFGNQPQYESPAYESSVHQGHNQYGGRTPQPLQPQQNPPQRFYTSHHPSYRLPHEYYERQQDHSRLPPQSPYDEDVDSADELDLSAESVDSLGPSPVMAPMYSQPPTPPPARHLPRTPRPYESPNLSSRFDQNDFRNWGSHGLPASWGLNRQYFDPQYDQSFIPRSRKSSRASSRQKYSDEPIMPPLGHPSYGYSSYYPHYGREYDPPYRGNPSWFEDPVSPEFRPHSHHPSTRRYTSRPEISTNQYHKFPHEESPPLTWLPRSQREVPLPERLQRSPSMPLVGSMPNERQIVQNASRPKRRPQEHNRSPSVPPRQARPVDRPFSPFGDLQPTTISHEGASLKELQAANAKNLDLIKNSHLAKLSGHPSALQSPRGFKHSNSMGPSIGPLTESATRKPKTLFTGAKSGYFYGRNDDGVLGYHRDPVQDEIEIQRIPDPKFEKVENTLLYSFTIQSAPEHGKEPSSRVVNVYRVYRDPEILLIPNLLRGFECEDVLEAAAGKWKKPESLEKDDSSWGISSTLEFIPPNPVTKEFVRRTSQFAQLEGEDTMQVAMIERRIASVAQSTVLNLEKPIVSRFGQNQIFESHWDGRARTMKIFLSDVESGGEIDFEDLGFQLKPQKGLGVLWSNFTKDGRPDLRLLHADLAVLGSDEEKFVVDFFIHNQEVSSRLAKQKFRQKEEQKHQEGTVESQSESPSSLGDIPDDEG